MESGKTEASGSIMAQSAKKKATGKKEIINNDKKKSAGASVKKSRIPAAESEVKGPHTELLIGGARVLIVGTAHVSPQSLEDVKNAYKAFRPDAVCVELCQPRYETVRNPDRWKNLDLGKVIKEKKLGLLAASLILSAFQKKIGDTTGMKPGQEMITACDLAEADGKDLALVDREIRITLSRAWGKISLWNKMWLGSNLFAGLLVKEEVSPEEIERLKNEDVLTDLFSNLPEKYSIVKKVIVDERDQFLAENIRRTAVLARSKGEERILAVVGAGHLKGIEETLKKQISVDLEALNEIPPKNNLRTILFWVAFSVIIGALSMYVGTGGAEAAMNSLTAWILGRSLGSGIGALIAGAHPLTILVTMIVAPVSVFIPGSRLWMFSAMTELWLKKPRVEDFENIATDTDSFRSFLHSLYNNRVLKLFFIISMVSLGLTLGNIHFWNTVISGIIRNF